MFHSSNSRRSPSVPAAAAPTPSWKFSRSCQFDGKSDATADTVMPVASTASRRLAPGSTFEKTAEKLRSQSRFLQELFPDVPTDDLLGKNRAELLALTSTSGTRPGTCCRTLDIVAALYEAATDSAPSATTYSSKTQFVQCDKQLTELDWVTYLGGVRRRRQPRWDASRRIRLLLKVCIGADATKWVMRC
ncbi:hypothetical protein LY76DRAFT_676999 [Colletotrichum caudatum]|nr:hypothetical protein LY76DRAFT_676999 [Colletotrichum caudatum]